MMTFGIGVNGSIETSAPFSTRGEPGNVVMAPQILLCVRSSFSCRQPFFGKFEPETVEGVADFPARIGLAVLESRAGPVAVGFSAVSPPTGAIRGSVVTPGVTGFAGSICPADFGAPAAPGAGAGPPGTPAGGFA